MLKKALCLVLLSTFILPLTADPALALKVKRFSQEAGDGEGGDGDGSGEGGGGPSLNSRAELLWLGKYQIYSPVKRYNIRLTIFADVGPVKNADRLCRREKRIRDRINAYLFNNPPETDSKGQAITDGLPGPIDEVIHKALKVKRNYTKQIYVVAGHYSPLKIPETIKKKQAWECSDVRKYIKDLPKD